MPLIHSDIDQFLSVRVLFLRQWNWSRPDTYISISFKIKKNEIIFYPKEVFNMYFIDLIFLTHHTPINIGENIINMQNIKEIYLIDLELKLPINLVNLINLTKLHIDKTKFPPVYGYELYSRLNSCIQRKRLLIDCRKKKISSSGENNEIIGLIRSINLLRGYM